MTENDVERRSPAPAAKDMGCYCRGRAPGTLGGAIVRRDLSVHPCRCPSKESPYERTHRGSPGTRGLTRVKRRWLRDPEVSVVGTACQLLLVGAR
jgi:hypothetical protein